MSTDFDEYYDARKVAKDVIETAKELNKLETGALVAGSAGFIALAFLVHFAFWVFASMSVALLVFRLFVYYNERKQIETASYLELYDIILARKAELWNSDLPEEEKRQLSAYLDNVLTMKGVKQLPAQVELRQLASENPSDRRPSVNE